MFFGVFVCVSAFFWYSLLLDVMGIRYVYLCIADFVPASLFDRLLVL